MGDVFEGLLVLLGLFAVEAGVLGLAYLGARVLERLDGEGKGNE